MQLSYYKKQSVKWRIESMLNMRTLFSWAKKAPSFLFINLITVYQWTLSPNHGLVSFFNIGQCKFRPTCSEYTKGAIRELGVVGGAQKGWKQLRKCY